MVKRKVRKRKSPLVRRNARKKTRKKTSRKMLTLFMVALIVVSAFAAYFFYFGRGKPTQPTQNVSNQTHGDHALKPQVKVYYNGNPIDSDITVENTTKAMIIVESTAPLEFSFKSDDPTRTKFRDFVLDATLQNGSYVVTVTKKMPVSGSVPLVIFSRGKVVKVITVNFKVQSDLLVSDSISVDVGPKDSEGRVSAYDSLIIHLREEKGYSTVIYTIKLFIGDTEIPIAAPRNFYLAAHQEKTINAPFGYVIAPGVYDAKITISTQRSVIEKKFRLVVLPTQTAEFYLLSPEPAITRIRTLTNDSLLIALRSNYYFVESGLQFAIYLTPAPGYTSSAQLRLTLPAEADNTENGYVYYTEVSGPAAQLLLNYAREYPYLPITITVEKNDLTYAVFMIRAISLFNAVNKNLDDIVNDEPAFGFTTDGTSIILSTMPKVKNPLVIVEKRTGEREVTRSLPMSLDMAGIREVRVTGTVDGKYITYYYINPYNMNPDYIVKDGENVYVVIINPYSYPITSEISYEECGCGKRIVTTNPHEVFVMNAGTTADIEGITVTSYIQSRTMITYVYSQDITYGDLLSGGVFVQSFDNEVANMEIPAICTLNNYLPDNAESIVYSEMYMIFPTGSVDIDGGTYTLESATDGYTNPLYRDIATYIAVELNQKESVGSISGIAPYIGKNVVAAAYIKDALNIVHIVADKDVVVVDAVTGDVIAVGTHVEIDISELTNPAVVRAGGEKLFLLFPTTP